jgi:hypothetical protein
MLRLSLVLSFSLVTLTLHADPRALAQRAVRGDAAAIRALRAMGQPGVDALMAIETHTPQFANAIDAVCRQRDCAWSGLYWHTDLNAAKAAAQRSGKPILSLRLLGHLDEELSCANSRYFRTILYPNREISAYLRANYVLHWQSDRPAPVVTIDFGNGRKMQRTVTGNSIHYILTPLGEPLDAIPGLYQPPAFLALLRDGVALQRELARHEDRDKALRHYHANAIYATRKDSPRVSLFAAVNDYRDTRAGRLKAWTASVYAPSKAGGEGPMLDRISFDARAFGIVADLGAQLKNMVTGPRTIDANARALIAAKRAASPVASMRSAKSLDALLNNLEKTLEADTRINEELHQKIHRWFVYDEIASTDMLNKRVYDELFETPRDDQWMGLVSDTSFTAIAGEGLVVTR